MIAQALVTTNQHVGFGKLLLVPYGIIPVVSGYILAKLFGLTGIAIAILLGEILVFTLATTEVRKNLQIKFQEMVKMIFLMDVRGLVKKFVRA
jgi:hypothetical protein